MNLPVEKRRQWIRSRREQRKLTKLARLRRQLMRYTALALLLVGGGIAFYKTCWNLPSQPTDGRSICIKGNFVASNTQILEALTKSTNVPIYALDPTVLEKKIESLDVIKQAFVRRYALPYPHLQVEVLEEFPWATLYFNDQSAPQFVISQSGRLVSIQDFPHVYQPTLKIYAPSKNNIRFNADEVSRWANWISYIEKQGQCPVFSIDMCEPHNVKVETSKFVIALGNLDSSLTSRLYRLASVLDILASEKRQPSYVNLGLNSNIPVKLAANEPASAEKVIDN
jgi:hypothetical protein